MRDTASKPKRVPTYVGRMSATTTEELYQQITNEIVVKERYLEPDLTAQKLADELHTNTRYISALMSLRFTGTFNATVNHYRIQRAIYMMKDKRSSDINCADIGALSGFANRQSFYTAFQAETGCTPAAYKKALNNSSK